MDQNSTIGLNLGGSGNFANQMFGIAGQDTISTGMGSDTLTVRDSLYGFAWDDIYYVEQFAVGVCEQAGQGMDTIYTTTHFTLIEGSEVEVIASSAVGSGIIVYGNSFSNQIIGNSLTDSFVGGAGTDTLYGFGGADSLQCDDGNDVIFGGDGEDFLVGGKGADALMAAREPIASGS